MHIIYETPLPPPSSFPPLLLSLFFLSLPLSPFLLLSSPKNESALDMDRPYHLVIDGRSFAIIREHCSLLFERVRNNLGSYLMKIYIYIYLFVLSFPSPLLLLLLLILLLLPHFSCWFEVQYLPGCPLIRRHSLCVLCRTLGEQYDV